jgi:hypothetical protein
MRAIIDDPSGEMAESWTAVAERPARFPIDEGAGGKHDPAVPGAVLAAAGLSEDEVDYVLTHAVSSGRTIWRYGWLVSYDLETGWCAVPEVELTS